MLILERKNLRMCKSTRDTLLRDTNIELYTENQELKREVQFLQEDLDYVNEVLDSINDILIDMVPNEELAEKIYNRIFSL